MKITSSAAGNTFWPLAAFLGVGIIWGSNFIYMKMAAELISPLQVVFYRVLFGFIPVLLFAVSRNAIKLSHFRYVHHFIVMSLLATSVYYYAFVKGTALLMSGVAGALSGSIPLFSFLMALIFLPEERATPLRLLGVLIGMLGVAVTGIPSGEGIFSANSAGVLYISFGALCVGASFVYAKKFLIPLGIPGSALTAYQLGFGLLSLAAVTDYTGMGAVMTDAHVFAGLVIGLGLLGTGAAYLIYYYLVSRLGAITASSSTYIPPVVALIIGAVIVGEPIGVKGYTGALLIFVGVFLLRNRR